MLLKGIDRLEEFLIASLMSISTLVIFIAVVHRYLSGIEIPLLQDWLLEQDLSWAQEFCIILFVWMAKFGAAYGVRTGIHVGVDVLVNRLTGAAHRFFVQAGLAAGVIFSLLLLWFGALLVWDNGMAYEVLTSFDMDTGGHYQGSVTPDLEWPTWIIYLVIPLGSALMAFRFLQVMINFAIHGELPAHAHARIEDFEEGRDVLFVGEAIEIAEDIERGQMETRAHTSNYHPNQIKK